MKPIFAIDVTADKNNEQINGQQFQTAKISDIQADLAKDAMERLSGQEEKSKLPKPIRWVRNIAMYTGLVLVIGIFRALAEADDARVTLAEGYANAPALFWIAGVCVMVWLALTLWGNRLQKKVNESDDAQRAVSRMEQIIQNCYAELGVPRNAVSVDVLMFRYSEKKGQIVPQSMGLAAFTALDCKVFKDEQFLHFADAEQRYSIPLESLQKITTVNKSGGIPVWNKETPFNEPPYKQYKLNADQYGVVHFKPYHILHFTHEGEQWGLYFPSYELPSIQALSGCPVE